MIEVERISFFYDPRRILFQDVSFRLDKGKILAVLGPNGAGKTTLLRCLMGFLPVKSGSIAIRGITDSAHFWRQVSYVPQARSTVFSYSVLNMVLLGRTPYIGMGRLPGKKDADIALSLITRLGLERYAEKPCSVLSGGQLQMILIARALAKEPELLIMDEPESNLDMKNQLTILDLIRSLAEERRITIILNTHFPAHALRIADKALLLGRGRYLYGDTGAAVSEKTIFDFFGVHAQMVEVDASRGALRSVIPTEIAETI
ncbi:MAG: ABC transporter ATP-binding protein [Spirochaetaceae bacterium]|jgi:iron complex transport system ATP-binding protein|nr:ABC transporter ATP-binding protein [Spirochaetaceae bacterium]